MFQYREGFSKDQFTLNDDNGHSITLQVGRSKFVAVEQANGWPPLYFLVVALVMLAVPVIFIAYKRKKALFAS